MTEGSAHGAPGTAVGSWRGHRKGKRELGHFTASFHLGGEATHPRPIATSRRTGGGLATLWPPAPQPGESNWGPGSSQGGGSSDAARGMPAAMSRGLFHNRPVAQFQPLCQFSLHVTKSLQSSHHSSQSSLQSGTCRILSRRQLLSACEGTGPQTLLVAPESPRARCATSQIPHQPLPPGSRADLRGVSAPAETRFDNRQVFHQLAKAETRVP